jgi:pimeloyl-ACP methyl ester carboxylesterase
MTYKNRRIRIAISLTIALVAGLIMATMVIPKSKADDGSSQAVNLTLAHVPATDRPVVEYKTVKIDGLDIFYREAGPRDAPTVLLLHGFPTSSHMFRNLIPSLADHYHVIAPDYPGFGNSSMPNVDEFDYTFDNLARVVEKLIQELGVDKYSMYLMDYGAPVGFRLAVKHPERVESLIIQNGNAYEEGLKEFWKPLRTYWNDKSKQNGDALRKLLTMEATKWQYIHGARDAERISPDNWNIDQRLLDRPGNQEIQLALFFDYGSNLGRYPKWQQFLREHQPPTLIVWGKNDHIFPADGAHPYKRDLKNLEFHLLDTGHFALEEDGDLITDHMRDFLKKHVGQRRKVDR